MLAEVIVEKCLIEIKKQDPIIKITSGPCFNWNSDCGYPKSVNWAGAVMWVLRIRTYKELLKFLHIDEFYYYRFNMGFNQRHLLAILNKDDHEIGKDQLSICGLRLAKQYCEKND